jgi:hypothetical protein
MTNNCGIVGHALVATANRILEFFDVGTAFQDSKLSIV